MTDPSNERFRGRNLAVLVLCIAAGLAGNVFSLRLFTGFSYLFGSIAVFMVVSLYGLRWGVLAGLVASSWTWHLFGHPYAMVWLTCEPLFVGWLLTKGRTRNIILYETVYWLLIGPPLLWFFFLVVMKVPLLGTAAATMMYAVIGISNALIASLLLNYVPALARLRPAGETRHTVAIHQLVFNLLMSFVLIPAVVVMVLHGRDIEAGYQQELNAHLKNSADVALYEVRLKLQRDMLVLARLVSEADHLMLVPGASVTDRLQLATQLLQQSNPDFAALYVGDARGRAVSFSPVNTAGGARPGTDFSDRPYYRQLRDALKPTVTGVFSLRTDSAVPAVAMGLPIIKGNAFGGYVMAGLRLQSLKDTVAAARHEPYHQLTLVDSDERVIVSTRGDLREMEPYRPSIAGTVRPAAQPGLSQVVPEANGQLLPLWQRSGRSLFVRQVSLGREAPWRLVVETPFAPYQQKIFREHIEALAVLLMVTLLALSAALFTSRRLSGPLLQLSRLTTDLPKRLLRERVSAWPDSMVAEISQLTMNFRGMASALEHRFQEITESNQMLEARVEERTRELSSANRDLQSEIAERQRTEQQRDQLMSELFNQVRFLQTLIDSIPNPVFYKDGRGLYQGCNRAFEESWGLSREEIVGKTVFDLYPAEVAETFRQADQELFERRGVQVYETSIRYTDGRDHAVIVYNATYENLQGELAGLIGTIVDITDRKRAETERDSLMLELAQKNKELEGIIYIASHDLRSPLVNIQGFSRKLVRSCVELESRLAPLDLPADQWQGLQRTLQETIPNSLRYITGSIEKMDLLLGGLLRLSRLGRAALCFERLDMRSILEKIVSSLAYQIETAGARVEVGDCHCCLADAGQVTQVFSNLLDNAIKYRSADRPLFVTVSSVATAEGIRFCVEDNGLGIPPDDQEKIWDIFHRLHPELNQGEGLGLTMVRRIVDRLGGRIWVESEAGRGSRFFVMLPRPLPPDPPEAR